MAKQYFAEDKSLYIRPDKRVSMQVLSLEESANTSILAGAIRAVTTTLTNFATTTPLTPIAATAHGAERQPTISEKLTTILDDSVAWTNIFR